MTEELILIISGLLVIYLGLNAASEKLMFVAAVYITLGVLFIVYGLTCIIIQNQLF